MYTGPGTRWACVPRGTPVGRLRPRPRPLLLGSPRPRHSPVLKRCSWKLGVRICAWEPLGGRRLRAAVGVTAGPRAGQAAAQCRLPWLRGWSSAQRPARCRGSCLDGRVPSHPQGAGQSCTCRPSEGGQVLWAGLAPRSDA